MPSIPTCIAGDRRILTTRAPAVQKTRAKRKPGSARKSNTVKLKRPDRIARVRSVSGDDGLAQMETASNKIAAELTRSKAAAAKMASELVV